MTDQIIAYNKKTVSTSFPFVAQKGYEKYLTDKYPDKGGTRDVDNIVGGYQLAVLSCMDTHPLVPKDIVVRGFIIDSETGALEEIKTIELFP